MNDKRRDEELDEELASHLRMAVRDRQENGESAESAAVAARRQLGNIGLIKEATRESWGGRWLERLGQDTLFGLRLLRRNRAFTLVAVLILALGIGATTAIFSVVHAVLLRPLPYPRPERIVSVRESWKQGREMDFADPNFLDLRNQNRTLSGLAEYMSSSTAVVVGGQPMRAEHAVVSRDFLSVMGVPPVLGRGFLPEDQRQGAAPVALVSDGFWRSALGASPDLGAAKLTVGGQAVTVVGVFPPSFRFPDDAAIWTPRELEAFLPSRTAHNWKAVGRLRAGVGLTRARADLGAIARRLKQQLGSDVDMEDAAVGGLQQTLTRGVREQLLVLLAAVGFLLLIACANVVNLQLAQATMREGELAVRTALGAGRLRLLRQFLVESLLLSLLGGGAGVLAAIWGVQALVASAPPGLPLPPRIGIDLPVLGFALLLCVVVAAGLAAITARRAGEAYRALREGGRGMATTRSRQRLGRLIVGVQMALTVVLLVGAGLLGRSLLRVLSVDPGFRTAQVVAMDLDLPWPEDARQGTLRIAFLDELLRRLRAIPGVDDAGGTSDLPLASPPSNGTFLLMQQGPLPRLEDFERLAKDPSRSGNACFSVASEGYLRTVGIPLLRGRLFGDRDSIDAPHVAVISQSLVRQTWPHEDPLGRTIEFGNMDGDMRLLTIVGVVGDVRATSLELAPKPIVYVSFRQRPHGTGHFSIVLRTAAPVSAVAAAARRIVHDLDPQVAPDFTTFQAVFSESLAIRQFHLILISAFAAAALLLAMAGIYGVMGYAVARRTREVGVRMALGALSGDVLRLVLGQGMMAAIAGLLAGVAVALALTRALQSLLFDISTTDPVVFGGVGLLLAAVALLAAYLPARRATRVDPQVALRAE
jgi:putative ABC transport system permease protein